MKVNSNIIRTLGFVSIIATILTAVMLFGLLRKSLEDIRIHWQENLLWQSSQLEIEYIRFRESLLVFAQESGNIDSTEVNRRFDILWSRVKLFQAGKSGFKVESQPQLSATLAALQATLEEQEARVTGLPADGDPAMAASLFKVFSKHDAEVRQFNRAVMRGEVMFASDLRKSLYSDYKTLTWLSGGAVLISLALLAFFATETQRYKRISQVNLELLERARSANRAKAAFLSMMSHNLRTPMNGILGMIALAKRYSHDAQQLEHLDQAAEASKQMNDLLHDMLDFSSLEVDVSESSSEPFAVADLAKNVVTALTADIEREGLRAVVNVKSDGQLVLLGDQYRLCQAVTYLARFLGQNAQQTPMALDISFLDGCIRAEYTFYFEKAAGTWQPELVLGPVQQDKGSLARDALGPAIARGVIENMGGTLALHLPDSDQATASVVLSVPLEEQKINDMFVRIEAQSIALAAICKSAFNALSAPHIRFYQEGDDEEVDIVVVETGGPFEQETCSALRRQYPKSKFVALGVPNEAALFDGEIKLPIDVHELRKSAFLKVPLKSGFQIDF